MKFLLLLLPTVFSALAFAEPEKDEEARDAKSKPALVSTFTTDELADFAACPPRIQRLMTEAARLTTLNLTYRFGSSDPDTGGMDCSGTIYHLLQSCGIKDTPRQSDEICRWVMLHSVLYRTENPAKPGDPAFSALNPGDLLFWSGTYEASVPRFPPVSHVMLFLGRRKRDGRPVVFGASDGRSYDGMRLCGVSIFDFVIPKPGSKADFYGYGPLPPAGK